MTSTTQEVLARRLMFGPSLIVVKGVVYISNGAGRTSVFAKHTSRKHGNLTLQFAGPDWAVVEHITTAGKKLVLFIPPQKRLDVSNGAFKTYEINYQWFAQAHEAGTLLTPRTQKECVAHFYAKQTWISYPNGTIEKYQILLDSFLGYTKENFAPSCQEYNPDEFDSTFFILGARIRYGMACVMEGQAIPVDCDHDRLVNEFHGWIDYREKGF